MSSSPSVDKISTFQCDEHDKKLLEYSDEKRKHGAFNNVTIIAGTQSIPANTMVLSCYSKFFEAMFETDMREKYQNKVEVNGFDGRTIKQLVDYIYTGAITVDSQNVMSLLAASDYLLLDAVKEFCFEYLGSLLTPENCLNIISASNLYKPNASLAKAYQGMSENLEEISQTEDLNALSETDLISIIKGLDKSAAREKAKYQAIVNWVKSDEETRGKNFPALFHFIDINQLPLTFLEDVVSTDSLVKHNPVCLNVVLACCFSLLNAAKLRETVGPKVLCVGGNERGAVFELFDYSGIAKRTYPNLPNNLYGHGVAKINNFIYCIGGTTQKEGRQVFQMNLDEPILKWTEVASLNVARSFFGCAVFDGKLVVAGGNGGQGMMEVWEEQPQKWKMILILSKSIYEMAMVACEGRLYVMSGKGTPSMECLSNFDGEWTKVESMTTPRDLFAAVTWGGFIYVIGGFCDKIEKSVEKYIPNEKKWVNVKSINIARYGHSACVVMDKIFVVGGRDANNEFVHEVECYDTGANIWSIAFETATELYCHALVVV